MSNKNLIVGLAALAVIATCIATYFYYENKKKTKIIFNLEQDKLS